jgi:hypothetical protein
MRQRTIHTTAALTLILTASASIGSAAGLSGTVTRTDGFALPGTYVGLLSSESAYLGSTLVDERGQFAIENRDDNGYLFIQPPEELTEDGLGGYAHTPRVYALEGAEQVNIELPPAACIVLRAYDSEGQLMRWEDFEAQSVFGAQFMYATDMDDEAVPATCWPVFDDEARAQWSPRAKGLPSLVVEPGQTYVVNVLSWETLCYGKLNVKADNSGQGFRADTLGEVIVVDLNLELLRTAINDIRRRSHLYAPYVNYILARFDYFMPYIEAIGNPATRAKTADQFLTAALKWRDMFEYEAALRAIPTYRQATLGVIVYDEEGNMLPDCKVTIDQRSHSFEFGISIGGTYDEPAYKAAREAGFEMATMLIGWNWTEKEPGVLLEPDIIDDYYGFSKVREMGFDLKAHGVVWLTEWGALADRAFTMPWVDVQTELLSHQQALLDAFGADFAVWEAMNEPAATNALDMPRAAVNNLLALAASNVGAQPGLRSLVNSPHEFDYGVKYGCYTLDDSPVDDFKQTYSTFLAQAEEEHCLDDVDSIGLQFYPGYKLNQIFGFAEGPAITPSRFADMLENYGRFGKSIDITEFCVPSFYEEGSKNGYWQNPWNEQMQAEYADYILTLAFANPDVKSITWWDMRDEDACVLGGGLLDENGLPKPVYERIRSLIEKWTTRNVQETTNEWGGALFYPFGGEYDITVVTPDGVTVKQSATVEAPLVNVVEINLSTLPAKQARKKPEAPDENTSETRASGSYSQSVDRPSRKVDTTTGSGTSKRSEHRRLKGSYRRVTTATDTREDRRYKRRTALY